MVESELIINEIALSLKIEKHESILELMWILTENPNMFKNKTYSLINKVSSHASSA